MTKDVQSLRVGGHDAVFDAVVDHLHEVAGAARTTVQVAVLSSSAKLFPTRRAGCLLDTMSCPRLRACGYAACGNSTGGAAVEASLLSFSLFARS